MMLTSWMFSIKVNKVDKNGFVPYADIFNHRRPSQTEWYFDDKRESFVIEAK